MTPVAKFCMTTSHVAAQPFGNGDGFGLTEVERHALGPLVPLVKVTNSVETRSNACRMDRHQSCSIRPRMGFNMNNLCTQVRQLQRAIWPGPCPRERQNPYPSKG